MEQHCDKITPEVLKIAVSKEHNVQAESLVIENISIKAGSKKGDGFACDILAIQFNATINGQKIEKNYIAKYTPDGPRREMLKQIKAFELECLTYNWLIPNLQKLREEKNLKPLAFPKCFYASIEESLILLENIKLQNFEVVVKKPEPLSLNAIKLVLKELAAFHATGLHFINTYPGGREALALNFPDMFTENFMPGEEMMSGFYDMTDNTFGSCILVTKKYGSEELSTKMEAYKNKIKTIMESILKSKWKICFITHGDAWYNNFMYRYSIQRDPTDVSIVDLQCVRLGRPGVELAYFFCSSTSPKQRKDHFHTLLKYYYKQFCTEIENLGEKVENCFTFEDLQKDFDDCYSYGFITGCFHSQVHLVTETSDANYALDAVGDKAATSKMMEAMEFELLAKAEASPEYRGLILGLAEEALERKVI